MFKHRSFIHKRKEAFIYTTLKEKPEANRDNSARRFDTKTERRKVHGG